MYTVIGGVWDPSLLTHPPTLEYTGTALQTLIHTTCGKDTLMRFSSIKKVGAGREAYLIVCCKSSCWANERSECWGQMVWATHLTVVTTKLVGVSIENNGLGCILGKWKERVVLARLLG